MLKNLTLSCTFLILGFLIGQRYSPEFHKSLVSNKSVKIKKSEVSDIKETILKKTKTSPSNQGIIISRISKWGDLPIRDQKDEYDLLLQEHPNSLKLLEMYSNFLIYNEFIEKKTEEILKKCLKQEVASELCQQNLTLYYQQTDQIENAKLQNEQCLKLIPNSVSCLNNSAIAALKRGDSDFAIEQFLHMKEVNGTRDITFQDKLIHWGLGLAFKQNGDNEAAAIHFKSSCLRRYEQACVELEKLERN